MPYIHPHDRISIDEVLAKLQSNRVAFSAGELNYIVSSILGEHLRVVGTRYEKINELIGVLECAKLELYRRIAAPYEDQKLHDHGDVYGQ